MAYSQRNVVILTIETTCDETAAAVVRDDLTVLGSALASQDALHERYGGIVPEIASRAHVERIVPVIDRAMQAAGMTGADIDAVAVAVAPGLVGSLLVGLAAAKALALAWEIPLVAIDHLQAHVYACRIAAGRDVFPCVGLVVSGGHTSLFHCHDPLRFDLLGGTNDDAAGEAFDKVASLLGLPYPGGPAIQAAARQGNRRAFAFPRTFVRETERIEFSFSGLKTAVRYKALELVGAPIQGGGGQGLDRESLKRLSAVQVADLAASFQEAVVDVLVAKAMAAVEAAGCDRLCVGGGVAANERLREALIAAAAERNVELHVAPPALCTDNAIMGAIACERLKAGLTEGLDLDVCPGLVRNKS